MSPRFSVLLPVHRPPDLLPAAIESVLAQTIMDFELLVVCDGAPEETAACARAFGQRDARVRTFVFPKGERHGEAHRGAVLAQATGEFVAHICDDDLWFPDHLAELEILLAAVDFGNVLHVSISSNGNTEALACDLSDPAFRRLFVDRKFNRFSPTFCGYRMDAYRRLPEGWAPAPPDVWTDLNMWRKFLGRDDIKAATRAAVTGLHFAADSRTKLPPDERSTENERWLARIADPGERRMITEAALQSLIVQCVRHERDVHERGGALHQLHLASQSEQIRASEALQAAEAARAATSAAFHDAGTRFAKTEARLAETEARLSETEARLARASAERAGYQTKLEQIVHSTSWRWTAPLRALVTLLRRS